ncbi:glycosyltransferase family 4 protein [Stenotrophomonas sp. YIM B06876]|uniref:MraY family glycosyltransferase n=1 Tax=Stenotrophomonas sp. YIM B06876 TaxID=3060211 RepID=UPI002739F510|nr:glycosyltransferase family 4 protein [Stenotrophomonas sp. YIM B06876]
MAALLLIVSFCATVTWLARIYALRRNLMDHPGERRSHQVATPRGGGVAIVVSVLLAMAAGAVIWPPFSPSLGGFSLGLVLVAGIGWWDDHRPLSAFTRLAVHALAALLLASLVWHATADIAHSVLALLITLSLINIWNFMDGINGLAVTQACLVAAVFALILPAPFAFAALVVLAACVGFLPFNFPRAKIFLGDVGSGGLGYTLAGLLCLASVTTRTNWLVLLLPLTVFLVDAGLTLLLRIVTGEQWMQPHTQHLYQRWTKCGTSHAVVTCTYAVYTLFGITLALISREQPAGLAGGIAASWLLLSAVVWIFLRRRVGDQ